MTYKQIWIDNQIGDPAIAPSAAYTKLNMGGEYKGRERFIRVCSSLKYGMPMMYWTCIVVTGVGAFDVDVRHLPNVTQEQADAHKDAVGLGLEAQQQIALEMILRAFACQADMMGWIEEHAACPLSGAVMVLHRCPQKKEGVAM